MEYRSNEYIRYNYWCECCGNEFTKGYECSPDYCHSCHQYGTFRFEEEKISVTAQYCPICKQYFDTSDYLNDIFGDDEKARWLANMVMHYRHSHVVSWDRNWGRNGYARTYLNVDYDEEKRKMNERAKRQILRKSKDYMISNGFTSEVVLKLENTEPKTIALYEKLLGNQKHKRNKFRVDYSNSFNQANMTEK